MAANLIGTNFRPVIEFGVSAFAMAGQTECGDLHVVELACDSATVAVVDGGGHGNEAAHAARIAAATIRSHPADGVLDLMGRCHAALRRTRGVVMSLAAFDGRRNTMAWLGVGNVEGVVLRAADGAPCRRESLFLRGGLVGYSLPPLRPASLRVKPGDIVVFATDGIRRPFDSGLALADPPQHIAEQICSRYGRATDDGLALVVRYAGVAP